MKVILKENIAALGTVGSVVEVTRGYARNFLIPQGKALEATPGNLALMEQTKTKWVQAAEQEQEEARALAARLEGLSVTIAQRVGEAERLYGSVTAAMIAAALEAQGLEVDRKQLELEEPIKKLGTYEIPVRLSPEILAQITVEVVSENA
ncbi:MAG: 50S ribosomal protein L9 [Syntrophales bacterium]|nr:50S ribosomal protein L9 [Syntrophales bacterium]MDD5643173.1 50S ribosomal protein L9 [Syntrophales bacterium]